MKKWPDLEVLNTAPDSPLAQVDLGSVRLLSGFQSQGPPASLHGPDYLRYVGLRVRLSRDGRAWRDCCRGGKRLFYADDRAGESGVVTAHSFAGLEAARFVRVDPITSVRWIGHPEKCFRFEVLGCAPGFQPDVGFAARSLPHGFVAAK